MNDDLTTPPDVPLDDDARARVRDVVVQGLGDPGSRRPWLVPSAAAAAVLVVAGVTGYVALRPDGGAAGPAPAGPAAPAPTSTSAPAEEPSPPLESLTEQPLQKEPSKGGGATVCVPDARAVLPGATPVAVIEGELGATTFLVAGERFVVCDTSGGVVTVHHPQPLDGRYRPDDTTPWRVSSGDTFVAGGIVTSASEQWGVVYSFPDGHAEEATTTTDAEGRTWWRMEYTPTDGVLVDGTNQLRLDPIVADVQVGGTSNRHELAWATDTCAQSNHGC